MSGKTLRLIVRTSILDSKKLTYRSNLFDIQCLQDAIDLFQSIIDQARVNILFDGEVAASRHVLSAVRHLYEFVGEFSAGDIGCILVSQGSMIRSFFPAMAR